MSHSTKIQSHYKIEDGKVAISTPYSDAVAEQCRKWSGKWEKGKGWIVNVSRLPEIQKQIGTDLTDVVEVEIGLADLTDKGAQYCLGWHVVASRRGRDSSADVYADLVAGEIPERGGSAKNPLVDASDDARFRLWVPRDFAITRSLAIVTDPKPVEAQAAEAAHMPALRAIGGIVGLIRAQAGAGTLDSAAGQRLADRLEKEHAELWALLVK